MDSPADCLASPVPATVGASGNRKDVAPDLVDPFLIEALQNPRHRLAVLRMELDIQNFVHNSDEQQFEFQHFPTSYLRLAAHRVAQHYGLHTMVLDNNIDSSGSKIVVRKTAESRYPSTCLADIPMKQPENEKSEQFKIAVRPRQRRASLSDATELWLSMKAARTVEERQEEYERARARIFSSASSSDSEGSSSPADARRSPFSSIEDNDTYRNTIDEERHNSTDSISSSRVAIFKDREKDKTDPDYDRSYDRYIRSPMPCNNFSLGGPFAVPQPPFVPYEACVPPGGPLPPTHSPVNYLPSDHVTNTFCVFGSNQASKDSIYMHCPGPATVYAHSYDHVRHSTFQAPFYERPLSFAYFHNR